jgi:hypothetical protein
MLLLGFHIVAVGALIFVVAVIAYRAGLAEGQTRARILIEESRNESTESP